MKQETYSLFKYNSNNEKSYVYEISRANIYTSTDRESAIKFDSRELAYMCKDYLKRRDNINYLISCITVDEVIIGEETKEEKKE